MAIIEKEKCVFYARTDKGFAFKVTVDILKNLLSKNVFFKFTKDGIFSHQGNAPLNKKSQNLVKTYYKSDTWNTYVCRQERSLEINLAELCNICKNIKKKYQLLLFIREDQPGQLYIVPIAPNQSGEEETHLARRLPIIDTTLNFSTEETKLNYQFHNGLPSSLFHSMCKNFSSAKSNVFTFLMYPSGRIYCTTEGTFSDCFFENGKGKPEEKEHEEKYKKYIETCANGREEDLNSEDVDDIMSASFYTGTFSCKLLKHIQKISGYNASIHLYSDPIDHENENNPSRPLCIKCNAPDSFIIEIYAKSNEQFEHETSSESQFEKI